jgi:hypothetical protein
MISSVWCFQYWFYLCCRIRMIRQAIWFCIFSLMAISCLDQPDCFSLNNNIVGISFKKLSNNTADTVVVRSLTADGIDSVFLTNVLATGKNIPLNLYQDSTLFMFEGLDQVYDLKLKYSSKVQFVSEECGSKFVISNLQAFSETFDSVRVVSPTPKSRDIGGTNIEVFRCPNTSRIKIRFPSAVTFTTVTADFSPVNYASSAAATTFLLPLNTQAAQTLFQFLVQGETTPRTLLLSYDRESSTLYNACGEQVVISGLKVTTTSFANATVVRTAIQDPNQTNIEITL